MDLLSVLVVDDDERLLSLLITFFKQNGFSVDGAKSASEARFLLNNIDKHFDVMIIDCMMPEESGVEFIRSVRFSSSHFRDIPAIMLTALDETENKLSGFESGVDDYVVKPFDERELVARVRSIIKRTNSMSEKVVNFGECSFNIKTGNLKKNGEDVYLSSSDVAVLRFLCSRRNEAVPRKELSQKAGFKICDRSIDVQITRLRRKIGDVGKQSLIIRTERYVGYSIILND